MHTSALILLAMMFSFCAVVRGADEEKPAKNGWDRQLFDYVSPAKLVVEETTPNKAQVNFWLRPPQVETADAAEPKAAGPAQPVTMGNVNIVHLRFKDALGDIVPAMLCTPHDRPGPFPLVIAIHGLTSNKAQVCAQVMPSLVKHGYAVLAADLPCHGERRGNPMTMIDASDPERGFQLYRKAVIDVRQLIDLAAQRKDLDTKNGVVLAGYSLGSWVSSIAGPSDDCVKAMVLMVGGALDIAKDLLASPKPAATDPRLSLAHFAGRPLLLLNGKTDNIVLPDWSKRLFAAAPQPKKQVWYDSGHLLPQEAYDDAANWIAEGSVEKRKAG